MRFQIGDRVECLVNGPDGNSRILVGSTGTVCRGSGYQVGVRWDGDVLGHNCSGTCTNGYGWYVYASQIRLYEEDEDIEIEESNFMSVIRDAK